jgi:hypothetical protein
MLNMTSNEAVSDVIVKKLGETFAGAMKEPAYVNGMKEMG